MGAFESDLGTASPLLPLSCAVITVGCQSPQVPKQQGQGATKYMELSNILLPTLPLSDRIIPCYHQYRELTGDRTWLRRGNHELSYLPCDLVLSQNYDLKQTLLGWFPWVFVIAMGSWQTQSPEKKTSFKWLCSLRSLHARSWWQRLSGKSFCPSSSSSPLASTMDDSETPVSEVKGKTRANQRKREGANDLTWSMLPT